MFYTGVGSRETPAAVLDRMTTLARVLGVRGWTLRSGGANGADTAFEEGAPPERRQIYLPWKGYNDRRDVRFDLPSAEAFTLAATLHPMWDSLKPMVKRLHARNCNQVLGNDLKTPSVFLVCWTADGCESEAERTRFTGGTATAIVLAERHGVPVFNLNRTGAMDRLLAFTADYETL